MRGKHDPPDELYEKVRKVGGGKKAETSNLATSRGTRRRRPGCHGDEFWPIGGVASGRQGTERLLAARLSVPKSMSSPQERQAFVIAVGWSDIDDIINALEPRRRFDTLKQAWNAATPAERKAFAMEYRTEINTLGWKQWG
jgi:hypothetical protein